MDTLYYGVLVVGELGLLDNNVFKIMYEEHMTLDADSSNDFAIKNI